MLARLGRRLRIIALLGRRRACPCCGSRWRCFAAFGGRPEALCPRCGSLERHRALALLLTERPDLAEPGPVLHLAPEPSLRGLLERPGDYISADLAPGVGDVAADITALPFADHRFGLVVCSHVLEHVRDDAAAMRELARVTAPGGCAVVMVPRDPGIPATIEEAGPADPDRRRALFGQSDHVRAYGMDLEQRLATAGFEVEVVVPAIELDQATARRYGLRGEDEIFLCRPRRG